MFKFIKILLISALLVLICQNKVFTSGKTYPCQSDLVRLCDILVTLSKQLESQTSDAVSRTAIGNAAKTAASYADAGNISMAATRAAASAKAAIRNNNDNVVAKMTVKAAAKAAWIAVWALDKAETWLQSQVAVVYAIKTFAVVLKKENIVEACGNLRNNLSQEELSELANQLQILAAE